jgi:hypothetical protein
MRVGTPTVVSGEVPSVHDLGAPEPAPAIIVDPFDVNDIASGLAAVLTDEGLRTELSVRGTRHALPRTWHASARAHVALWKALR